MKLTSRKPSELSESLHRQLNSYALAASAAGVGMLALAQPAEAKIVYTKANREILPGKRLILDLNHDGTRDFFFTRHLSTTSHHQHYTHLDILKIVARGGNGAQSYATALRQGVKVGPGHNFAHGAQDMVTFIQTCFSTRVGSRTCHTTTAGPWRHIGISYLGLKFFILGKAHYGWARLNVSTSKRGVYALLTGYAYETIPYNPIITGRTHGKEDVVTVEPASLGHLARGASTISTWRTGANK